MSFDPEKMTTSSHETESNSDPRFCQQKPAPTTRSAKRGYAFIVFLLAICWGLFALGLVHVLDQVQPLDKLWSSSSAIRTEIGIDAIAVGGWGLLVLVSTLILPASAQAQLRLANEIDRDGVTVQGEIVDKWTFESEETAYCVGYYFTYLNTTRVGRDTIKSSLFKKLRIGNNVPIRLLPRDPMISRVEQDEID